MLLSMEEKWCPHAHHSDEIKRIRKRTKNTGGEEKRVTIANYDEQWLSDFRYKDQIFAPSHLDRVQ